MGPQPHYLRDECSQSSSRRQGKLIRSPHKSSRHKVIELNCRWKNLNFLKHKPGVGFFHIFSLNHGVCFGFVFCQFILRGGHFRILLYAYSQNGGLEDRNEMNRKGGMSVRVCVCPYVSWLKTLCFVWLRHHEVLLWECTENPWCSLESGWIVVGL